MGGIPRHYPSLVWHCALDLPTDCNGCGEKLSVPHNLSFPKGGLILGWHNDAANEWDALSTQAINPSDISYEPKINSRIVQGERNRAGSWVSTGKQKG